MNALFDPQQIPKYPIDYERFYVAREPGFEPGLTESEPEGPEVNSGIID